MVNNPCSIKNLIRKVNGIRGNGNPKKLLTGMNNSILIVDKGKLPIR